MIQISRRLFLLFLGLKLTELITWSWWWVTAPLWGPLAFLGIIAGVVFIGAMLIQIAGKKIT